MALGSLSPVAIQQFFDANGDPLAGGKLFFYEAGTTTPTPAYSDVNLTIPLANPVILDAAGRAPELFLGAVSYKQVLKTAGDVTIWTADNIIPPAALRSTQGTSTITGTQNDVPIPAGIITSILFENTAPLTVTGFAGGSPGQILILRSGQLAPVHLVSWSVSTSMAGNTLLNYVESGPTSLSGNKGTAVYVYVQVKGQWYWLLIAHEQGAWIRLPYVAGRFQCTPSGTWTVEDADIKSLDYRLNGTSLLMTLAIENSSVAGTPTHLLVNDWPYSFKTGVNYLPATCNANGPYEVAAAGVDTGQKWVKFLRSGFVAWPVQTNYLVVYTQFSADVT